ncbi:DUF1566 domain-containing protein [Verrucomicrobiota bacterium]
MKRRTMTDSGKAPAALSNEKIGTAISRAHIATVGLVWMLAANAVCSGVPCRTVDTGQESCSDDTQAIATPSPGETFAGQDAQYDGNQPSYTLSGDGLTVYDNNTGLTWQQSPDTNGDGNLDAADKKTWNELQAYPATLNAAGFGGYSDWRLPSIKDLYSLIDFRGTDPMVEGTDTSGLTPFIDTDYFAFAYGDTAAGERIIDSQWASSTLYVADNSMLFGVNFADGRIKGYGLSIMGGDKTFFVLCCRGNTDYGINDFVDNGDGTVTDTATGLMWQQADSGTGMNWEDALAYAENLELGGYRDWRLPNAKELQSILDYTRSPDTTSSAAIDPVLTCTPIVNLADATDYPFYWTGTTHLRFGGGAQSAAYVAFGRGLGQMAGTIVDVHGAGCQRSDPKDGDPADYPAAGHGPQGDVQRVFNHVRCVRGGGPTPWSGGMRVGGGWKHLEWIGWFTDASMPWVYHLQHGWLYSVGEDSSGFWSYSADLDTWFWTADTVYPWMFFHGSSSWMYYLWDSYDPRWFYSADTLRWESY